MFYLSLKSFLKLNFWKTFKTFYLSIIIIFSNFVNQKKQEYNSKSKSHILQQ